MLRLLAVWLFMTGAAFAAPQYSASTTANVALRAAPSVDATQVGTVPAGTALEVTVCFAEGAFCHVTGPDIDGYMSGDLLITDGTTVQAAEAQRWAAIREQAEGRRTPIWESSNIVVWGDSLSDRALGEQLIPLLPGRSVAMQGVAGENGEQIAERMLADTRYTRRFKIIWDRHYTKARPADYLRDLAPMIEKALGSGSDFLVVSDIRQLLPTATSPDVALDATITNSINAELAERYPGNFLDVSSLLESPPMRAEDGLHLSPLGIKTVAKALASAVLARATPN